jgi:hypothetical protein
MALRDFRIGRCGPRATYAAALGGYLALLGLIGWAATKAADRVAASASATMAAAGPERPSAPVEDSRAEVLAGKSFGASQTMQQWPNRPQQLPPGRVQSLGIFGGMFMLEPPPPPATYATVCVRLCDGFYWPISFAASKGSFGRDDKVCQSSCNMPTRLFIYRNPGGSAEQMTDLRGQPYSRLPTAFQYRASYSDSCKCRAHPWEQEAKDLHRMYALQQAVRKGNTRVLAELQTLEKQVQKTSTPPARTEARSVEPRVQPLPGAMTLGGPKPAPGPSGKSITTSPAWREGIFSRN